MHNSTKIAGRKVLPLLKKHLKEKEITVILGPRQVGKTTLMKLLQKHLIEEKKVREQEIFFFNLDLISDWEFLESQEIFVNFLRERISGKNLVYVFIDEVQRIPNAGLFLKGVYDLGLPAKFIVSGSSSLELKKKIQEPLTGRKQLFYVYPFSFEEYLDFSDPGLKETVAGSKKMLAEEKFRIDKYLESYILYGGYPRVVVESGSERKKEILQEIYQSYLEKDIVGFLGVKDVISFSNLVRLLAIQNGKLLNIHQLSKTLNLNQRTAEKFLYYLEQTFVVRKISPFFTNAKKELVKMPKVYFVDMGIRNFALSDFSGLDARSDRGELLENFVLRELEQKIKLAEKINFWRSKGDAEVDFVIRSGTKTVPVEVKTKQDNLKIGVSFENFLAMYAVKKGYIFFKEGMEGKNNLNGSEINFIDSRRIFSVDIQ